MKNLKLSFLVALLGRANSLRAWMLAALLLTMLVAAPPGQAQNTAATRATVPTLAQLLAANPNADTIQIDDQILPAAALRAYLGISGSRAQSSPTPSGAERQSSSLHNWATKWPGGRVAYTYDGNMSAAKKAIFESACREWEKFANLRFTPRVAEANYIVVTSTANVSNSYIGMVNGPQIMNLADWADKSTAVHEMAHALGIIHEQSRPGRDTYVTINTANITAGMEHNFAIVPGALNQGAYDFNSVMHYHRTAFSSNTQDTITCNAGYTQFQNIIGQRSETSALDASGMAAIYGPPQTITLDNPPTSGTFGASTALQATSTYDEPAGVVTFAARPASLTLNRAPNITISSTSTSSATDSASTTASGNIVNASLTVDITHTYRGDLVVTLIAPDETSTVVQPFTGYNGNDLKATYDVSSAIAGKPIAGNWTVKVQDLYGASDGGTWNSWSLSFFQPFATVATDSDGPNAQKQFIAAWDSSALAAGQYEVRATLTAGLFEAQDTNEAQHTTNSAPTVSGVVLTSSTTDGGTYTATNPKTNDFVKATATASDAQNDTFTFSYQWKKNGTDIAGATSQTLALATAGNGDKSDALTCVVTATETQANGLSSAPVTSNSLTVENSAPIANVQSVSTNVNTAKSGTLTSTDPDAQDMATLTFAKVSGPTSGTVVVNANGSFTYTPKYNTIGSDSFTFTANDGTLTSAPATVTIAVVSGGTLTATITTPADGATVSNLSGGIAGTATNNFNTNGVQLVRVVLARLVNNAGQYWTGSAWTATPTYLDNATIATPNATTTTWNLAASELPSGADLTARTYSVRAYPYDNVLHTVLNGGQFGYSGQQSFKVTPPDTTAPVSVTITAPAKGATVADLSGGVSGDASDNEGGSGLRRVMVVLTRRVNNATEYWNGSAWVTSPTYLYPTLTNPGAITSAWTLPTAMTPSASDLLPNTYYLRAWAYDGVGLSVYSGQQSFVIADTVAPVGVSFTNPMSDSTVSDLSGGITGNAQDDARGSGIKRVSVVLTRRVNNATQYWNGSAWVATPTYLYPTLSNPGGITTNFALAQNQVPIGANLSDGAYTLRAYAYDKGNLSVYSGLNSFMVVTPVVSSPSSNESTSKAPSSSAPSFNDS